MAPTLSIPIPILVSDDDDENEPILVSDDDENEPILVSDDGGGGEKEAIVVSGSDGDGTHASKPRRRARRRRRSAGNDGRNPAYEVWLFHEEVTMLTAMAAHRRQTGELPQAPVILRALRADPEGRLRWMRRKPMSTRDVGKKVQTLRARYKRSVSGKGGHLRSKKLDELSREVWPEMAPPPASSPADEQSVMICSSAYPPDEVEDGISCSSSSSSDRPLLQLR